MFPLSIRIGHTTVLKNDSSGVTWGTIREAMEKIPSAFPSLVAHSLPHTCSSEVTPAIDIDQPVQATLEKGPLTISYQTTQPLCTVEHHAKTLVEIQKRLAK